MKFSVTSYSFQKLINSGEYSQLTLVEKVKDMGFDAIEFTDLIVPEGKTELEYAKQIREEADRVGIEISSYTVGADMLNGSDGDLDKEIERIKGKVDVAEVLGTKFMRHDAGWGYKDERKSYMGFNEALPVFIKGCKAVTEYAKTKGIVTMIENHGFFCQDSDRVEKIVCGVGDPNFGVLFDCGNFLCADENPVIAAGKLANYVKYVHAKDFLIRSGMLYDPGCGFFRTRGGNYLRGTIVGQGDAPVKQCIEVIKNSGYDGYFSVEFEGIEDNIPAVEQGLVNLKLFAE